MMVGDVDRAGGTGSDAHRELASDLSADPCDRTREQDGAEANVKEPAEKVEHDIDELLAKASERDEYLELAQRTQADFENFRKRISRESAAAEVRGVAKLAKELLPALDNIERALQAAEPRRAENVDNSLADGIRLVHAELAAALTRVGVESYSPEGEQFDPEQHEAMAQVPADGKESGSIIEIYEKGYRIGETVLRPARVVVAE